MNFLLAPLLWLLIAAPSAAASLTPADFAYGCSLPVTKAAAVYGVNVPLAVYETVVRPDLGDLRIFNASGEEVPHALRSPSEPPAEHRQPVPFFPLPKTGPPRPSDLSLRVSRNAEGAVVTVDAGNIAVPAPRTFSFLFDLNTINPKPQALELHWSGENPAGLFTVSLSQSGDLSHWSSLVDRAVLADLQYNGGAVTARRIGLPTRTLPYLRLDCVDCRQPLRLESVQALSGTPASADQWQWLRLEAEQMGEQQGERVIEYRLAAKVRVTALRLDFPAANSLLRAVIESRPTGDVAWRPLTRNDFYRLEVEGQTLANPLVPCPPTSDPWWRVRILSDSAGLNNGAPPPHLALGWRPAQLVFLGRGQGPYTLAFGSTRAAEQPPVAHSLVLSALQDSGVESRMQQIEPGPIHALSGDQALKSRISTASWTILLLWLVLAAGVAALALMIRSLFREMQAKRS